jgi:E3 ubiquitin-protein ligase UBR1
VSIESLLDFFLDAFESAPRSTNADIDTLELWTFDGRQSNVEVPSDPPIWCALLWNDELHGFQEVIEVVQRATGCNLRAAERVAVLVDERGRTIVDQSMDPLEIKVVARTLQKVQLGVTIRAKNDVVREEAAAAGISWLLEVQSAFSGKYAEQFRKLVCEALLNKRQSFRSYLNTNDKEFTTIPTFSNISDIFHMFSQKIEPLPIGSFALSVNCMVDSLLCESPSLEPDQSARIQHILLNNGKYWKKLWIQLTDLISTTLISSPKRGRPELAKHFASAYVPLLVHYMVYNRENDVSFLNLAIQLLSTPTIALDLVKNRRFFHVLLSVLCLFFGKRSLLPGSRVCGFVNPSQENLLENWAVQERGYMVVLDHLGSLLGNESVKQYLLRDIRNLDYFLELLTCIQGKHAEVRQKGAVLRSIPLALIHKVLAAFI